MSRIDELKNCTFTDDEPSPHKWYKDLYEHYWKQAPDGPTKRLPKPVMAT